MCIFQVECVLVSILSSKNYYFNGQLFMNAQRNIRCYMHEMMMPIGIYKQDQRGFHSTTEGNSIDILLIDCMTNTVNQNLTPGEKTGSGTTV